MAAPRTILQIADNLAILPCLPVRFARTGTPSPTKAVKRVDADIETAPFLEKTRDFAIPWFALAQLPDQFGVGSSLEQGVPADCRESPEFPIHETSLEQICTGDTCTTDYRRLAT